MIEKTVVVMMIQLYKLFDITKTIASHLQSR